MFEVEGKEVKVGDVVGFKSDIEQYGTILMIEIDRWSGKVKFVLENENGFEGEYLRNSTMTEVFAEDCWL